MLLLGDQNIGKVYRAIAAMHETHFKRIARYCAVQTENAEEAEDLASETFVRALRSARSIRNSGAQLEAWLFKTAHNLSIDYLRRNGGRKSAVPLDTLDEDCKEDGVTERMERRQDIRELGTAMRHLSETQRQVLAFRFSDGMKAEDVAALMGMSAGAVRQMQYTAIKKLRETLETK
ncbi:MAG: sigma-70 family RNA polymerase sigma factor [Chloroflexi bacterium]|nr:sigma-70 family RNA polymerase sigma factor [Chloroflexota bacterium]